jgi:hypothetical protein
VERFGYFTGPTFSGNGYVAWRGAETGAEMTLPFTVPRAGTYAVQLWLGRAGDGVVADVLVDGRRLGTTSFFEAGAKSPVKAYGPETVGSARLDEGPHRLMLRVTGVDPRVSVPDRFAYVDAFTLKPSTSRAPNAHP